MGLKSMRYVTFSPPKCKAIARYKFRLALRHLSVRQASGVCHAIPIAFGLVVTANVHPQLSGAGSLIPIARNANSPADARRPEVDIRLR
jgi:hypothetical protein